MADDLSLLFKLRGDNSQLKGAVNESRQVVNQLKESFSPQLTQSVTAANKTFSDLSNNLQNFVAQRVPLVGGAFARIHDALRQIAPAASSAQTSLDGTGLAVAGIASAIGRTEAQVAGFVANLNGIGREAARNTALVGFLGGALAGQLRPQLDEAAKAGDDLNKILQGSGKSKDEALRLVQALGLIGDASQRNAAAVAFFGDTTAKKLLPQLERFGSSLGTIATASGRSGTEVAGFIARFAQLGTEAEKRTAAIEFFGSSLATKLGPALTATSNALAGVSAESATAGSAITALAGPIGLAALAALALAAAAITAGKEIFEITKKAADFQGKMFDLALQTGLAVKTLSALEVTAKTTGGELGSITQAVVSFQRKLDEAQDPLSKTAEQFRTLGVTTSDTETSLRSAFAALAKMPEGFAQTNAAAELFGARGGQQVLAILKETNGDLDGTIKRLEELGILINDDAARAADVLNDQLATLEFQSRALQAVFANDLIPAVADLARNIGELLRTIRPLVSTLGSITGSAVRFTSEQFKGLSLIVQALTRDYVGLARAIQEAHDSQQINPINVPGPRPVPLPSAPSGLQTSGEAVTAADAVLAEVKRRAAQTNQALSDLFQQGRIDRQRQTEGIIANNKRILQAETDRIDAELNKKEQEIKALDEAARNRGEIVNRETEQYRAINTAVAKLQQERLDKENQFDVDSRALRAKAAQERTQALRSQIQNEGDIFVKETENTILRIEAEIKRGARAEEEGFAIIDQLEQQKIESRIHTLEKQKQTGFLTIQEQKDLNQQLTALQQERDGLEDAQRARRQQREIEAAARNREIVIANLDAIIQQEQVVGERRIETLKALAEQRVITEEEAAKQILAIRLSLLDDEIEATKAQLTASKSITDKNERVRVQTDLNNQIKILTEQRKSIQANGDREIEEGRQKDLENERRYAEELRDIKARIRDIERDAAQEVIRLMILHFASRKDIIRARLQADLDDERARHEQANETIRNLKLENSQSNKTKEEKLETERQLNQLLEAELERHLKREEEIKTGAKQEAKDADSIGRLGIDIDTLNQFKTVIEDSIIPLGEILRNTFQQVADAIGQTVANWVLLGETGPAVGRKLLAVALANLAREATVNAIKELALGFATLFFNPAESAAHFTSAALWGSIAGVSAIAGRGVAGDLFKSKSANGGAGGGGSNGSGELNPLSLARNAGPGAPQQIAPVIRPVVIQIVPDGSKFGNAVTAHIVEDVSNAGPIREVIAGDGNLNRG